MVAVHVRGDERMEVGHHRLVRADWNGHVIAASTETIVVEGNHYFPPDSVRDDLLVRNGMVSLCFWKGLARYRSIEVGGERLSHAAWYYPQPLPWIRKIKDHVSFGPGVRITTT
jgi:uncharacterized protein (DUF427 family)